MTKMIELKKISNSLQKKMRIKDRTKNQQIKEEQWQKIQNNCVEIIPLNDFHQKMKRGTPLVIKAGFDPTAENLHLGHMVLLRKLGQFQRLGHHCHFLIGDFTGQIGDPSGRSKVRTQISAEQATKNAQNYQTQIKRILDIKSLHIIHNTSWYNNFSVKEMIRLCTCSTVAQMLARDDFANRHRQGNSISLVEFIYPLLQAYDSVAMKADIEIGGTDQKFNLLLGREIQMAYGQEPQCIITLPLLIGLDGEKKMSKTFKNTIDINSNEFDIFSQIMSISDKMMPDYFFALTDYNQAQVSMLMQTPLQAKKILAKDITSQLAGNKQGEAILKQWEIQKSACGRKSLLIPPGTLHFCYANQSKLIDALLASKILDRGSKSSLRILFKNRAIKLGSSLKIISDENFLLVYPNVYPLKIGKKKFIVLEPE